MSHEIHEQIEHAGHAAHDDHHSRLPQWIGITVAVLGVLLALCSAQVGAARTELIATMVEEDGAKSRYLAVTNKYRQLQAQLQLLHAAMPDIKILEKKNKEFDALVADVKNPDTKQGIDAGKLQTDKVLNTVTPTESDIERFAVLLARIREETAAAKEWSESYHDVVRAHSNTAESFELALLGAEIGIVIASVGLLLARRAHFAGAALVIAVVLGVASIGIAATTKITATHTLHAAEHKIHEAQEHYSTLNRDKEDLSEDKKLEEDIRRDIKRLHGES